MKTWILISLMSLHITFICAQNIPPTTSLVYPGIDNKLVYIPDSLGNKIPDFSNAGYKGGGVSIPTVAVKATVWPVLGDNARHIQEVIDSVSALQLDTNGFRGAILLKMGYYNLEKPLYIKASGVVLRGEGMGDTGTILFGQLPVPGGGGDRRYRRPALVNIEGETAVKPLGDTEVAITTDYVPVGSVTFSVESAKTFKSGDKVIVRRFGNQEWIRELGLDSATVGKRNHWKPFDIDYDRTIIAVSDNSITLDAPIFCAIESRWGGGAVYKYNDERIENIGVENLRGISQFDPSVRTTVYGNMDRDDLGEQYRYQGDEYYADENHYSNFINITNAKNVWVRNMSALHFASSVVQANAGTKYVTVQDCQSIEPVSQRWGGRRFTFQMNGQFCLVQRCLSEKGRHSFVSQSHEASGNVFLECTAINPYSSSEPHNHWVNGALYDNVKAPLTARFWDYVIGWAGANIVFWNCEGDFLIQSPPTAQNYSFGHIGVNAVVFNAALQDLTKPNGHVESMDKHVTPRSLYLTQLMERLGKQALENIQAPL